jgi:hypothetical protein
VGAGGNILHESTMGGESLAVVRQIPAEAQQKHVAALQHKMDSFGFMSSAINLENPMMTST